MTTEQRRQSETLVSPLLGHSYGALTLSEPSGIDEKRDEGSQSPATGPTVRTVLTQTNTSPHDSRAGPILVPTLSIAKQALSNALNPSQNAKPVPVVSATTPAPIAAGKLAAHTSAAVNKNKAVIQKQTRSRKAIAAFRKRKDRDYAEWKGRIGVHVQVDEFDLKLLEENGYLEEWNLKHGWDYVNHYDVIRLWQRHPSPELAKSAMEQTASRSTSTGGRQLTPEEEQLYNFVLQQVEQGGFMTDDSQQQDPNEMLVGILNQMDAATPEVFIFSFGAAVFWNFPSEEAEQAFLDQLLFPLEDVCGQRHDYRAILSALDDLEFVYDDKFMLRRDVCQLSTKEPGEKMAVSFGLAKSSLLSVYEWMLQQTIERNSDIPELLATTGTIPMTKLNISKEIGRIFLVKHGINLDSNLHDTPEEFWEDDRFEPIYVKTMEYFEIDKRMKLINARLGMLQDLHKVLIEEVQNHHATHLEWIVIWLILIEVVFELYHAVRG